MWFLCTWLQAFKYFEIPSLEVHTSGMYNGLVHSYVILLMQVENSWIRDPCTHDWRKHRRKVPIFNGNRFVVKFKKKHSKIQRSSSTHISIRLWDLQSIISSQKSELKMENHAGSFYNKITITFLCRTDEFGAAKRDNSSEIDFAVCGKYNSGIFFLPDSHEYKAWIRKIV